MNASAMRWQAPVLDAGVSSGATGPKAPPSAEALRAIEAAAQREGEQRGHAQGYADGFAQGSAEVRRLVAQIEGILDNFSRPLDRLEDEVMAALADLAVRIAGSLVGRAYHTEPALLAELASTALDAVGGGSRDVELRLHPDDITALAPVFTPPATVRLTPDPVLTRGDLRVHAEHMYIDGSLEARLRAALETVLARSARA